ncbi:MAG TPA: protein kinase, partial [Gemmatimonadales bacterium]|nr:protein kinase [Gemmatimonadales bacterium]
MTEESDSLAEALGERYAIERELARGGMATVYLARDAQGDRSVAIKVMHRKLADALGAERFRREIAIAGSMTHPLIVPLYDSGQAGSLIYYIMPYVEGE